MLSLTTEVRIARIAQLATTTKDTNKSCPATEFVIGLTTDVSPFINLKRENNDLVTDPKYCRTPSSSRPPHSNSSPKRLVNTIAQAYSVRKVNTITHCIAFTDSTTPASSKYKGLTIFSNRTSLNTRKILMIFRSRNNFADSPESVCSGRPSKKLWRVQIRGSAQRSNMPPTTIMKSSQFQTKSFQSVKNRQPKYFKRVASSRE
mmetsp:Transcript_75067/g.118337  ORF Transcript_75067/g.118337 Transcript_75067/m.118337 type:complete len:204 (-) Transcript_75067:87-698(-)